MLKVTPKSREAWRAWLEKNHAAVEEAWLVFFKKAAGKPTLSYNDAVEEALCFGWIDGVKRALDAERYMHRFTPRKLASRWSALNKQRAERMLKAGLMAPAGERAIRRAKENGAWAAARVQKEFPMPPEFAARLARDKKAAAFFSSLAPSYQRAVCRWVGTAKREETKARRLDEAMRRLKNGEKLGMV